MQGRDAFGHYSLGVSRKVFVLGRPEVSQGLVRQLASLSVMVIDDCTSIWSETQPHVVIIPCAFNDSRSVLLASRALARLNSPDAYKILYAQAPNLLNIEQFIFSLESGAHFLALGPDRDTRLKEHLKKQIIGKENFGTSDAFQQEYQRAKQQGDVASLNRLYQKISDAARGNMHTLRLLVQISQQLGQLKKTVFHLRQIFALNSQDLWALNTLMKIFVSANKAEMGLQLLNELTDFGRYNIVFPESGLPDCLGLLPRRMLSLPMYSYLTLRAALAMRAGQTKEALLHYQMALEGCPHGVEEQSKVLYNMGLAELQLKNYQVAIDLLERSVKLGETKFAKAVRPLKLARKQLHEQSDLVDFSPTPASLPDATSTLDENLGDIEII